MEGQRAFHCIPLKVYCLGMASVYTLVSIVISYNIDYFLTLLWPVESDMFVKIFVLIYLVLLGAVGILFIIGHIKV